MKKLLLFSSVLLTIAACTHINTIHPQKKNIVETVYASGKILADSEYNVFSINNGTIVKKLVKDGDVVIKGQPLFVIDYSAAAARLDAAQSNLNNVQNNASGSSPVLNDLKIAMDDAAAKAANDSAQYFRLKNLWQQNIGTQNALDNAYTAYQVSLNAKKSAHQKYISTLNDLNVSVQSARSQVVSAQTDLKN